MNVVPISKEEVKEPDGYIRIYYTDGTNEVLQVDSFGQSEEMPQYLTMWSNRVDGPVGFYSNLSIKKIIIMEEPIENNS